MKDINSRIRVLVADDHSVVRTGIRQFLETADDIIVTAEAGDGEEAIQLIDQDPPDVVVLDIQMPKMTGIEVTRWIRSNHPKVGILILTAYDDEPYALNILQAGANGYVLKTAKPEEITRAVREVNAGRSVVDAVITEKMLKHLTHPPRQEIDPLSSREVEVLQLVAKGLTNKLIALQLNISDRTVQGHLAHIFNKLHASSRTEAVMRGMSAGWITQEMIENDAESR